MVGQAGWTCLHLSLLTNHPALQYPVSDLERLGAARWLLTNGADLDAHSELCPKSPIEVTFQFHSMQRVPDSRPFIKPCPICAACFRGR